MRNYPTLLVFMLTSSFLQTSISSYVFKKLSNSNGQENKGTKTLFSFCFNNIATPIILYYHKICISNEVNKYLHQLCNPRDIVNYKCVTNWWPDHLICLKITHAGMKWHDRLACVFLGSVLIFRKLLIMHKTEYFQKIGNGKRRRLHIIWHVQEVLQINAKSNWIRLGQIHTYFQKA